MADDESGVESEVEEDDEGEREVQEVMLDNDKKLAMDMHDLQNPHFTQGCIYWVSLLLVRA